MTAQPSDHPPAPPERLSEEEFQVIADCMAAHIYPRPDEIERLVAELREHRAREEPSDTCSMCGYPADKDGCSRPC